MLGSNALADVADMVRSRVELKAERLAQTALEIPLTRWVDSEEELNLWRYYRAELAREAIEQNKPKLPKINPYTSENAITLNVTVNDDLKKVQLIRKNYFKSALDVIDHFDFTICQLATDGYEVVSGAKTFEHIKEKRIEPVRETNRGIVKRLIKYISYGYKPDPRLVSNIIDNPQEYDWMFNNIDENYENAF